MPRGEACTSPGRSRSAAHPACSSLRRCGRHRPGQNLAVLPNSIPQPGEGGQADLGVDHHADQDRPPLVAARVPCPANPAGPMSCLAGQNGRLGRLGPCNQQRRRQQLQNSSRAKRGPGWNRPDQSGSSKHELRDAGSVLPGMTTARGLRPRAPRSPTGHDNRARAPAAGAEEPVRMRGEGSGPRMIDDRGLIGNRAYNRGNPPVRPMRSIEGALSR